MYQVYNGLSTEIYDSATSFNLFHQSDDLVFRKTDFMYSEFLR